MKKIILPLLLTLFCSYSYADPAWLSPNIKKSDCANLKWADQRGRCYAEFNNQKLQRLNYYLIHKFKSIKSENCNPDTLITHFENSKKRWNEFVQEVCSIEIHCIGFCGSGHSGTWSICFSNMNNKYTDALEQKIREGIPVWGCPIKGTTQLNTLKTKIFTVYLNAQCENGLLGCDNVKYTGVNNKTNEKIELFGKELLKANAEGTLMPEGFVFENNTIQYIVLNSGILRVIDTTNNKVLLEETGYWK